MLEDQPTDAHLVLLQRPDESDEELRRRADRHSGQEGGRPVMYKVSGGAVVVMNFSGGQQSHIYVHAHDEIKPVRPEVREDPDGGRFAPDLAHILRRLIA